MNWEMFRRKSSNAGVFCDKIYWDFDQDQEDGEFLGNKCHGDYDYHAHERLTSRCLMAFSG